MSPALTIRLSQSERSALEAASAGSSLSSYVRARLFDDAQTARRRRGHHPVQDHRLLAQVLARLGASGLAVSLAALGDELRSGRLEVSPETEAALRDACRAVTAMRGDLLRGLGLRPEDAP